MTMTKTKTKTKTIVGMQELIAERKRALVEERKQLSQRELLLRLAESHYEIQAAALQELIVDDWLSQRVSFPPLTMGKRKLTDSPTSDL